MSIVVDSLFTATAKHEATPRKWCHMASDTGDRDELIAFARKLGLKDSWFQEHAFCPHYDLTERKRIEAVAAGAIRISGRLLVLVCSTVKPTDLPEATQRRLRWHKLYHQMKAACQASGCAHPRYQLVMHRSTVYCEQCGASATDVPTTPTAATETAE